MVAGRPNVDHPSSTTALSVLPLGQDQALTSRVRRESEHFLYVSPPRTGTGEVVRFVERDLLELSWQADDGLRSVSATAVDLTEDSPWRLRITGPATRIQRRDAVRAPIGLSACRLDLHSGELVAEVALIRRRPRRLRSRAPFSGQPGRTGAASEKKETW